MNAARIHSYGGPEVLVYEEAPLPVPGPNEVLVRVHATSVNATDVLTRAGFLRERYDLAFPAILGWDMAGVIESVGPAVTGLQAGDAVYGMHGGGGGTYAEYLAMPAAEVASKPTSLDFSEAAAMPLSALTAWQALFEAGALTAGQTILIHGAAGGVGAFAVQFAKWNGASVIGTASRNQLDWVRRLGADQVIDYAAGRFEEAAPKVDLVLDTVGGETQQRSWALLTSGGRLVSLVGPPDQSVAAQHGVQGLAVFVRADAGQLAQIGSLIDTGQVRPVIAAVLPLSEARQAHILQEKGGLSGKIVLQTA